MDLYLGELDTSDSLFSVQISLRALAVTFYQVIMVCCLDKNINTLLIV